MRYLFLFAVIAISSLACDKPKEEQEVETSFFEEGIQMTEAETNTKPAIIHTVFFWTKKGTTVAQKNAFEQGLVKLGTCPQIKEFYWGPPASTEKRDVVDNSYDYAISVHFDSLEDQAAYQEEPIHLAFIEANKDIWDNVIVYDNKVN